jgi:hypothetical protein
MEISMKNFTPLAFLASLGAGGIAVTPFVLMQYTLEHGAGLITRAQVSDMGFTGATALYFMSLESVMIIFLLLHFVLMGIFLGKLLSWLKTEAFTTMLQNPLKNSALLAPFISLLMTMNVVIGPVRYFLPAISQNFQQLMMPALLFWALIFVALMWTEIYLLKISFEKSFDVSKIQFSWLLHPFALGMLATVGTGIAAMAQDVSIANTAAFMSMIPFSMGVFLLVVKVVALFKSHFSAPSLPEKNFLPGLLIVIPNITLFAISAFRFGHFLERTHGFHLDAYFYIVIGLSFAFEIWYLLFGVALLYTYFKENHFKEFYMTQWGLICPFVAFVVLGAFAYHVVLASPILYGAIVAIAVLTIFFYFELLYKQVKCANNVGAVVCE